MKIAEMARRTVILTAVGLAGFLAGYKVGFNNKIVTQLMVHLYYSGYQAGQAVACEGQEYPSHKNGGPK